MLATDNDFKKKIAETGGVRSLVYLLKAEDDDGKKAAADALGSLALNDEDIQMAVIEALVGLLEVSRLVVNK